MGCILVELNAKVAVGSGDSTDMVKFVCKANYDSLQVIYVYNTTWPYFQASAD